MFFKKYQKLSLLIVITFLTLLNFDNFSMASTREATVFVNEVTNNVISLVEEKNISESEKQKKLNEMFKRIIDIDWIGKFALGKYWDTSSDSEKKEYIELFEKYLINMYVPNFKKYNGQKLKILNVSELGNNEYLVQTTMTDINTKNSININYRIIKKGSSAKDFVIFDIIAEGVSLITTQRAEFSSIMSKSDMKFLISTLKSRVN